VLVRAVLVRAVLVRLSGAAVVVLVCMPSVFLPAGSRWGAYASRGSTLVRSGRRRKVTKELPHASA
jgi:hypothetical protein